QDREAEVRAQCERLRGNVADPEAGRLLEQFLAAHRSMGQSYRAALQLFKDHDFDSAAGDKAVAGIDRAPTELLTKAREGLVALAAAQVATANEDVYRAVWKALLILGALQAAIAVIFVIAAQWSMFRPLRAIIDGLIALGQGHLEIGLSG